MIKLYSTTHCPRCRRAEKMLGNTEYEKLDVTTNRTEMARDCIDNDLLITLIKEAPVMVTESGLFTGEDVLIELEDMKEEGLV